MVDNGRLSAAGGDLFPRLLETVTCSVHAGEFRVGELFV
jgi:hypothetical protein